jgi:hypothetical protein
MSVTISLFIALLAAGGLFVSLYLGITLLVGGKRAKASPKIGISPGDVRGSLNIWASWDPTQFNVQIYRLMFKFASPFSQQKEGVFSITFDTPQTTPFIQIVKIPDRFVSLIQNAKEKFLLTVEVKSVEELTLTKTITSSRLKAIYQGTGSAPEIANKLAIREEDKPTVLSLDYSELVVRKKKLKDLEAQAQAKAKAKPAAAAPAATTASKPAPAPAPAPVSTGPVESAVKSVREMVAATNAAKAPVEKP